LQISKVQCEGKAKWTTISQMGTVSGSFKLFRVQNGQRLGTVTAGGKTNHMIIGGRNHKYLMHNIGKIGEINVTFPNYGQDMTIKLPVKVTPKDWKGPATVNAESLAKA
jgi:hypothetical protein